MKNRKSLKLIAIILVVILLTGILLFLFINKKSQENNNNSEIKEEYTPLEEITNEQIRQTIVTLYFKQKETNTLMPEARLIDAKLLAANPYDALIKLLIAEPKNDKLESTIPKETVLISAELKNDIVYLNFSKEFVLNHEGGEEKEKQTIDAIVNTLTELNEVNAVRILIDGQENQSFQDNLINFQDNFVRNY